MTKTLDARADGMLGFLTKDLIRLKLDAATKNDAIAELVALLAERGKIDKKDEATITAAIMKRESLGSTGIGHGLAIPHAKANANVKALVGAFGRCGRGIDYGAVDGEPVNLLFLMVSPASQTETERHLKILKKLASLARDAHFCRFLCEAKDEEEIMGLLKEAEDR